VQKLLLVSNISRKLGHGACCQNCNLGKKCVSHRYKLPKINRENSESCKFYGNAISCIGCSFKFILKIGVEESNVNAPLVKLQSKTTNNAKSEVIKGVFLNLASK
jgi:hypothetical protein